MRNIYVLMLVLVAMLPIGCERAVDSPLVRAESVMTEHPDTALAILRAINPSGYESDRDRHIYTILLTEARYKCFYNDSTDSLISLAADYFDSDMESPYRLKAYYYKGIILNNANRYGDALISLKEAQKSSGIIKSDLWAALVDRALGDTFDNINNPSIARYFYNKSLKEFERHGDKGYISDALYDVCRIYGNLGDFDSCAIMAEKTIRYAETLGDTGTYCAALASLGQARVFRKEYDEAIKNLERLRTLDSTKLTANAIENLGLAYLGVGDMERAEQCERLLNRMDSTWKRLSIKVAESQGDFKKAFYCHKVFAYKNLELYSDWVVRRQAISLLDSYELLDRNATLEAEKGSFRFWILLAISLLVFAGATIVVVLLRNEKLKNQLLIQNVANMGAELLKKEGSFDNMRKENAGHMERIKRQDETIKCQNDTIKSREEAIEEARDMLAVSLKSEFSLLDSLVKEYYDMGDEKVNHKTIFNKVNRIVKGLRDDKAMRANLIKIVNSRLDNLVGRFETDFPDLKKEDKMLFVYVVLDFSGKTIGFLMGITDDTAYARKRALRQKIAKQDEEVALRYLKFF